MRTDPVGQSRLTTEPMWPMLELVLALVTRSGQARLVTVTLRLEVRPCWDTQVNVSLSSSLA